MTGRDAAGTADSDQMSAEAPPLERRLERKFARVHRKARDRCRAMIDYAYVRETNRVRVSAEELIARILPVRNAPGTIEVFDKETELVSLQDYFDCRIAAYVSDTKARRDKSVSSPDWTLEPVLAEKVDNATVAIASIRTDADTDRILEAVMLSYRLQPAQFQAQGGRLRAITVRRAALCTDILATPVRSGARESFERSKTNRIQGLRQTISSRYASYVTAADHVFETQFILRYEMERLRPKQVSKILRTGGRMPWAEVPKPFRISHNMFQQLSAADMRLVVDLGGALELRGSRDANDGPPTPIQKWLEAEVASNSDRGNSL